MRVFLACSGMMFEQKRNINNLPPVRGVPQDCPLPLVEYFKDMYWYELRSYAEIWKDVSGHTMPKFGKEFMLDSGAFSISNAYMDLDINSYIQFVKKYESQLDYYANFDVIPYSLAKEVTHKSAMGTLDNQKRMEDAGLNPLPVFHKGEPFEVLEYYIENYDFIYLGGLVGGSEAPNSEYFQMIWDSYLADAKGFPKKKYHAFGMTSTKEIIKYPWYSVDSSTWLVQARNGHIYVPQPDKNGEYDYMIAPFQYAVSNKSGKLGVYGEHLTTSHSHEINYVHDYLDRIGLTYEGVSQCNWQRFIANVRFYVDFCKFARFPKRHQRSFVDIL